MSNERTNYVDDARTSPPMISTHPNNVGFPYEPVTLQFGSVGSFGSNKLRKSHSIPIGEVGSSD